MPSVIGTDEGLAFAILSESKIHAFSVGHPACLAVDPRLNSSGFGILLSIEERDEF